MWALGILLKLIDRRQSHVLMGGKVRRHYMPHIYADGKRAAWAAPRKKLETPINQTLVG